MISRSCTLRLLLGGLLSLVFCAAFAQSPPVPFFEAQKGDIRLYVMGSMHLGKYNEPLRQEIVQALQTSSKLVQELSDEEMAKAGFVMASQMCPDACLRRQISEEAMNTLLSGEGAALRLIGIERMPAWMAASMLALMDYQKAGFSTLGGTEMKLKQHWKKPIEGLEKAEEQIASLSSLRDDIQREMLEGYLATPQEERLQLGQTLYDLWLLGDPDALYEWNLRMSQEEGVPLEMIEEMNDVLLGQRNRLFVQRIQPYLAPEQPVFMAVGALHLGGPDGVLELLRKQGFTVTRR